MAVKTFPNIKALSGYRSVFQKDDKVYIKFNTNWTFAKVDGTWTRAVWKGGAAYDYLPVSSAVSLHLNHVVELQDSIPVHS